MFRLSFALVWLQVLVLAAPLNPAKVQRQAAAITRSMQLIDTHNDIPSFTVDGTDIGNSPSTHTDIQRLHTGGVGAVFFSVYVAARYTDGNHSANRALQMIDTVQTDIIDRHPETFQKALTAHDIVQAHRHKKIAALMGLEGGHAIEDSPRLLRDYYRLGVRYMTLTHTNTNGWADSSGDKDDATVTHHNGLTEQGRVFVQEMNRLGMMVDISHVADKTFYDALETSRAPLIASHSSCRAVTDVPRNMTDDMLRKLAAKGGVIQININCGFISERSAAAEKASPLNDRYRQLQIQFANDPAALKKGMDDLLAEAKRTQIRASLSDVVAHIDHARQVAGIDHIGIGTDFDGITCTPTDLDDVSQFPNLTKALLTAGYSRKDIEKIYGRNTLRLMRDVEKVSADMRAGR